MKIPRMWKSPRVMMFPADDGGIDYFVDAPSHDGLMCDTSDVFNVHDVDSLTEGVEDYLESVNRLDCLDKLVYMDLWDVKVVKSNMLGNVFEDYAS